MPTRLWLRRLDRKTRDAELRVRRCVLLKVAAGLSRNAAAREVGCVPSTAMRILARFEARGKAALLAGWSELRLHLLPPYCPNENRIELLWLDLHANVTRNHRCRTIDELLRAVHGYLSRRFDLAQVIAYAA